MLNNLRYRLAIFMQGRCGIDQLNRFISMLVMVIIILNIFLRSRPLSILEMVLLVLLYLRAFSKNLSKRYQENCKYLEYENKFRSFFTNFRYNLTHFKENREKNRGFHIWKCPRCKQKIRIPKGKGNIMVTCPRCKYEFRKKS